MNPAKLHSSLAAAVAAKTLPTEEPLPIIVRVRPAAVARGELTTLARVAPEHEFGLLNARAMWATSATIAQLTADPTVDLIWPDLPVHTWLDDAVPLIQAPRVWSSGFTGRGVKVAVLDTGVDAAHPDLAGRVAAYRDFVDPAASGSPGDPNGHGTHVAGIIAGSGVGSGGRYRGVAPDADLVVARVLDASGNGRTSLVMAGLEWAVQEGARVINISLGGPPFPSDGTDALSALCNAAVEHGVVVCVAAGNMGPGGHTIGSPSAAERVITVGACEGEPASATDHVATFSSRGPTADGRAKPDLVFPGVGIVAARGSGTALGEVVDSQYTAVSGTSQATPMATGTAALLLEANARLAPADVKARLIRAARRLPDTDALAQGSGRGDAYNAFTGAEGTPLGQPGPGGTPTPGPTPPGGGSGDGGGTQAGGCLAALVTGFLIH